MAVACLLRPVASAARPLEASPALRFDLAEFVISDSVTPPESGWQPQLLPDSWFHNHRGLTGIAWYRIRFRLEAAPAQAMALYVGRVSITGQFWVNGWVLNPEVRFTQPDGTTGSDMFRWPHLAILPVGLLRTGENVLHIRVEGRNVGGTGLWDVRIGALEALSLPWRIRDIPQRVIPQVLFVLLAAGSIFALLVWWRDRRTHNLHFAGALLLWTAVIGLWVGPDLTMSTQAKRMLLTALLVLFHWMLLGLFYRYSGSEWRWYPRVLAGVSAPTLVVALGLMAFRFDSTNTSVQVGVLFLPIALLRLLATVMLLQAAWRRRSPRVYALAATELLWYAGHVQVIGIIVGWWSPYPFRLFPSDSLPLLLALLYLFQQEFVRGREQAIRDRQAALSVERERILQDVHDGMGTQLVTALRLAKREEADHAALANSIEEALEDLRLITDSLDAGDQGLLALLGNFRYRLEPRLAALGIRLEWHMQPLPEPTGMTPHNALNVLRVVREAVTNALKHAQPSGISVEIVRRRRELVISVDDDGIGIDPAAATGSGHGLVNMRNRAQALGATLAVAGRDGGGTSVSLRLPE